MKPIIIQNSFPMEVFHQTISSFEEGVPLFIETDLNNLDLDSALFKRLSSTFQWHFRDSCRSLLNKMERPLTLYEFSYYDRLHDYFGIDQVAKIRENTNNIVCNWDPKKDFDNHPRPCFLTMKFIPEKEFLHVSVTFRTRDVIKRMYPNFIALRILMEEQCKIMNKKMGKLFDYSNQIMTKKEDLANVRSWIEFNEFQKKDREQINII